MSTPLTEQLKPCPFCGEQPISADVSGTDATGESYGYWVIECRKCNSQQYAERFCGVHGDEEKDAIIAWNTRADTERKLSAAREGLRGISRERRWNGYRFVETEAAEAAFAALAQIENSSPQTTEKPSHQ